MASPITLKPTHQPVRALPDPGLNAAIAPKAALPGATYEQAAADAAHASFVFEDPSTEGP